MSDDSDFATRAPAVLAVTSIFIAFSTVFVALRLVSRFVIVRKVGLDDYFIILAWVLAFALSFSICYGTGYGLGRHEQRVPDEWQDNLNESQYAFSVIYNPALMATKTSILVFYLGLSKSQRIFRWATIVTLVVVNVAGLALSLLNIFQCQPIAAVFENPLPPDSTCTDIITLYQSSAPVNIITDLAIFFLPMPILTAMRLPRKQKIILVITFSFGVFVAVVDVVRVAYLQQAAFTRLRALKQDGSARASEENDFSWYASYSFMWSAIEVNVGIMCACVPALKPLVSRFLPSWIRNPGEESTVSSPDATLGTGNTEPEDRLAEVRTSMRVPPVAHTTVQSSSVDTSRNGDPDASIDVLDFLTTPMDAEFGVDNSPTHTGTTLTTGNTPASQGPATFFDFVQMGKRKSFVRMTNRESYFPVSMVTVLFFVWGFAYGLLDVLNAQFQVIAEMSSTQTISIHSAYFAGYFVAPLTFGRLVLKKWGFKACYTVGLSVYACGTLVFWPAAVLTSFPAFLVSNFIVGLGLSTLEVSANTFIALCGPPQYAEIRLNLSQGVQAIGAILSPLLAKKVLFNNVLDAPSLVDTQWTYLGIAFFTVLLAVGYIYVPLPEATDDELEEYCGNANSDSASRFSLPTIHKPNGRDEQSVKVLTIFLGLTVFSMFLYCGAQESVNTSFANYLQKSSPGLSTVNTQAIGHTVFAISRFVAAGLNTFIMPKHVLLASYLGAAAFAAALIAPYNNSTIPAALLIMVYALEGPIFGLIFAMGVRSQGRNIKDASALITAAISGGAVFPPISNAIAQDYGPRKAYSVVLATFVAGIFMPLWLYFSRRGRKMVDPSELPAIESWARRHGRGGDVSESEVYPGPSLTTAEETRQEPEAGTLPKEANEDSPTEKGDRRRSWFSSVGTWREKGRGSSASAAGNANEGRRVEDVARGV